MFISEFAQSHCADGTFQQQYFSAVVAVERKYDPCATVSFFDWFAMFCGV